MSSALVYLGIRVSSHLVYQNRRRTTCPACPVRRSMVLTTSKKRRCCRTRTGLPAYNVLLHCVYERFTAGDGNHTHLVVLVGFDFDSTIMCRKWSGSEGKNASNTGVNPTNLPGNPRKGSLPYDVRSILDQAGPARTSQDQAGRPRVKRLTKTLRKSLLSLGGAHERPIVFRLLPRRSRARLIPIVAGYFDFEELTSRSISCCIFLSLNIPSRMRISTNYLRASPARIATTIDDGGRRRLKKSKTERNEDLRTTDSNVLQFHGNQGPFGRCKGDCDSSYDCMPGLVCLERSGIENNVPGCAGIAYAEVDYCVSPSDIDEEQRQDDGGIPDSGSTDPDQKSKSTPAPTSFPTAKPEPSPLPPTSSDDTVMPTFSPTTSFDDSSGTTYSPTTTSSTNSKVIAAINTGDQPTSSQSGANAFEIKSTSGYAVMGVAFLSLIVLAVVGLALQKRKKRASTAETKDKLSLATVIVPFDDGRAGKPRWGDGSSINQLTQAFESETTGIEVIDMKSIPSIRSAPSADSFDAEPNHSTLHRKYPKLFGLPERDETGEIGPMDTIEL